MHMTKSFFLTALLIVSCLAIAACLFWIFWRIRKRRAWPRLPIVLAHGLMGFDEIVLIGKRHHYFRGIPDELTQGMGVAVYRPRVAGSASIAARAEALCAHVRALPEGRVNLIAHSMGGLDARYAITHLGLADRVASLTTMGTPHHGTPLAGI